ncbi:MAG: hypothetical protein AAB646_00885 [Patescibacteria group bacterium]
MKYFVYAIIVIVATAVLAGFFIVGSPKEARLRRFDEQRVQNLQFLQSEIINYWVNKSKLPAALSNLEDNIRGVRIPTDPESGAAYEYKINNNLSFALCANFARPNIGLETGTPKPARFEPYYASEVWDHGAGLVCFERTIDPEIYKPIKPIPKQPSS